MDLRHVCRLFAGVLEYPQAGFAETVRESEALVASVDAEAGALLGKFREFVDKTSQGEMEEIYTHTFDLNAISHPYIGGYILGQDYKRSAFLQKLKEIYNDCGFDPGNEMPDHLAVMLRFLAACDRVEAGREIARDAVLPALELMLAGNGNGKKGRGTRATVQPYTLVLQALRQVLKQQLPVAKEG